MKKEEGLGQMREQFLEEPGMGLGGIELDARAEQWWGVGDVDQIRCVCPARAAGQVIPGGGGGVR
jgi:hypothetical protein